MCPLFREFHDLGNVAKIMGCECSKSHVILVYYLILSLDSKNTKNNVID